MRQFKRKSLHFSRATLPGSLMSPLTHFSMPTTIAITARLPSITNAFVSSIIPVVPPTQAEVDAALDLLGMATAPACVYCGDPWTEWDHLRPLVVDRRPTGYISEIDNLVPACGKCNQSKGNREWQTWIVSAAARSPKTRQISDLDQRIERLATYEASTKPKRLNFHEIVGSDAWDQHWSHLDIIAEHMKTAQAHAVGLRSTIRAAHLSM